MNENNPVRKSTDKNISRRSFMKLSAGVAAGVSFAGYGITTGLKTSVDAETPDIEEKIVPTIGSHNCGGRCQVKAHVKDGVVQRISTDTEEDKDNSPQLRGCQRCRSYRRRLYHPDRLKYPMKRVGKRGEGKFERITWDEATTTIANEIKRISSQYGPEAIYSNYGSGEPGKAAERNFLKRLLGLNGGYLNYYGNYSTACTMKATPYTYGTNSTGNSRDSWQHSKLIILWGFNPAENIFGTNTVYYLRKAKEAGAKIVVVDPRYTDTAATYADEWIPILPTTDTAVMDAMTYVIITEKLYDKEFVDKYCSGFDEEHMPEGVPDGNSLKPYILGLNDGVPKTPEWAEKISGVPADKIRQLAREYATSKPAALIQGYGPQRHSYGEQTARGGTVLPAITGNVGVLGGWASGLGAYSRQSKGNSIPIKNPVKSKISFYTWDEAIERGHEMGPEDGVVGTDRLSTDIKLLFNVAGNVLSNQHSEINNRTKILEDENKCEFIVVSDQFMTPSAKYADILLPSDMNFEREDIFTPWVWGDYMLFGNKAVDTIFECRNSYDWITELSEKLGLKEKFTEGKSREDWLRYIVDGARDKNPGFPSYEEFKERGVYKWEYNEPHIAFKSQIEDPENNPFNTPTGKIEIFSKPLFDMNNPDEIPAIPKYVDSWEGPNDPLKEQYPLQCIGWHIKSRSHSTYANVDWLKEAARQEMWINPKDAKERGIENDKRVHVFNERGKMEIYAKVTPRIRPGVVAVPQGAWYSPDENGVDQGGCTNTITKYHPTPLAKGNPQHTNLVEVKKA